MSNFYYEEYRESIKTVLKEPIELAQTLQNLLITKKQNEKRIQSDYETDLGILKKQLSDSREQYQMVRDASMGLSTVLLPERQKQIQNPLFWQDSMKAQNELAGKIKACIKEINDEEHARKKKQRDAEEAIQREKERQEQIRAAEYEKRRKEQQENEKRIAEDKRRKAEEEEQQRLRRELQLKKIKALSPFIIAFIVIVIIVILSR